MAFDAQSEFDRLENSGNGYDREGRSSYIKYEPRQPEMKTSGGDQPLPMIKEPTQSFDSIIMECQDMLSIEDEVQKKYEDWLGGDKTKIEITGVKEIIWTISSFTIGVILCWIAALESSFIMAFSGLSLILASLVIPCISGDSMMKARIKFTRKKTKQTSESSKFQFLKESYSGTISNLNERLELVQNRISEQINIHRKDKEQVQEFSDLLGDTSGVINKIDSAISGLVTSSVKLSAKKVEINKSLNEYIGESGVIAQKEKEIKRLKVAQELSDRMKVNFHTTMEITKSVDVLTDVIMPGLKQLMSLKIPELIEKVNFDCDKERVFLEINR